MDNLNMEQIINQMIQIKYFKYFCRLQIYINFKMTNKEIGAISKLKLIFTFLLLLICSIDAKEVDSFNLLLPTAYHPSQGHAHQLVVTEGGCYNWDSTDPAIISVKGTQQGAKQDAVSGHCFSNGLVHLLYEGRYSSSVYITAKDQQSSELASIPVRIRDLKRISIFTKSKIMNLREIQNLEIYGFDEENNTFTSLEGLRFKWTIYEQGNVEGHTGLVEKIPLKDSSLYMPLDFRKKLQSEQGIQTDLLVVQAKKVGKVLIRAQCLDANYETINDEITLYIQERFDVWPSAAQHIIAGSTYQYFMMTPSGHNISLPASHYSIELTNSLYTVSNELLLRSPGLTDDKTDLIISDTRTKPHFVNRVEIYSYQPDQINVLLDRDTNCLINLGTIQSQNHFLWSTHPVQFPCRLFFRSHSLLAEKMVLHQGFLPRSGLARRLSFQKEFLFPSKVLSYGSSRRIYGSQDANLW